MRVVRLLASCFVLGATVLGVSAHAAGAVEPGVVGHGSATPVLVINERDQLVQFGCTATAYGVYSSTSVDTCTLHVYDSQPRTWSQPRTTLPLNAVATRPTVVATDIGATLEVCWEVSANPPTGQADTDEGCTIVNTLVAA